MPLRDHFRPPRLDDPPWSALAAAWVAALVAALNRTLPRGGYTAYAHVHSRVKTEAELSERAYELEALGPPTGRIPLLMPDVYEVWIGEGRHELGVAGVVILLAPGSKQARAFRDAHVQRTMAYLERGVGVVCVDVIPGVPNNPDDATERPMQVTSCVPCRDADGCGTRVWAYPVALGAALPPAPLALRGGPVVTVDLEAAYEAALRGLDGS